MSLSNDDNDLKSNKFLVEHEIGIIRASISELRFFEGREIDTSIVERLAVVFSVDRCRRYDPDHYIPAVVNHTDLRKLLTASNLSQRELLRPMKDGSPCLVKTHKSQTLLCMYRGHRTQAALRFLPKGQRWWTIRLFLVNDNGKQILLRDCKADGNQR